MLKRIVVSIVAILIPLAALPFSIAFEVGKHVARALRELCWILPAHLWGHFYSKTVMLGQGFEALFNAPAPEAYFARKTAEREKLLASLKEDAVKSVAAEFGKIRLVRQMADRHEQKLRFAERGLKENNHAS